jgi:hypothetical protein
MIKFLYRSSSKVPFIFARFYWNLNIFDIVSKNALISNFMKIRPLAAQFFYVDGRTDRHDESKSRFPKFCEGA